MTWNIWWRFGPWEQRQPGLAAEIAAVDADVVLLQEVWSDDGDDQAQILADAGGYHLARSTRESGQPYRFGNAVLSRWPILRSQTFVLPGADGEPSHRSAILTVLDAPHGPTAVATTHLDWHYDQSTTRQRQLEALVPVFARWQREHAPEQAMVFGGDFNAMPDSDEVRRLTGLAAGYEPGLVFTDGWAATNDDLGYTWTRENPNSPDAQWPKRRLDYVFVSWPRPKPTGNPVRSMLAGVEKHDGVVPSDHYAVVVDLDDRPAFEEEPNS